jgi:hypothetical protein
MTPNVQQVMRYDRWNNSGEQPLNFGEEARIPELGGSSRCGEPLSMQGFISGAASSGRYLGKVVTRRDNASDA